MTLQKAIKPQLGLLQRYMVETASGENFVLALDNSIRKILCTELNFLLVFCVKGIEWLERSGDERLSKDVRLGAQSWGHTSSVAAVRQTPAEGPAAGTYILL